MLWKSYAYVLSRKWSALSIGGNGSIPRPTNHFLLKEKEKMFVFSKMILRSTQKFLRILPLFEASVVFLSTQKCFRNSNFITVAFKTCVWCHIFLTRCLGGLQVPPIFLLKLKHTKKRNFEISGVSQPGCQIPNILDFTELFDFNRS